MAPPTRATGDSFTGSKGNPSSHRPHKPHEFRWRSREVSRLEGLSDAIFGFAVTLLIVALEVPRTSGELLHAMRGFGSFAITFGLLYMLWYRQFTFFRRYGLEDKPTVVLNGMLLFVVLFFVFPLKFFIGTMVDRALGASKFVQLPGGAWERVIAPGHMPLLLTIYGAGFTAVSLIFLLLYSHAWRLRHELDLDELETFDTRRTMEGSGHSMMMGLIIVGLSATSDLRTPAGPHADTATWIALVVLYGYLAFMLYRTRLLGRRRKVLTAGRTAAPLAE